MDDFLTGRLARLEPPGAAAARGRAIAAVPSRVEAARRRHRGGRSHSTRARLAFAATVVLLALVLFSVFTAPGRALTNWVGERLGLGEPGGHPTLQVLRHAATHGTSAQGRPAYVLVRGPGPRGGHYEFVTYRMKPEPGKAFPADGARCFEVEFPELRNLMSAGCGLPPARHGLLLGGIGGNSAPNESFQFVSGRASADVASVAIEVAGRPVPVALRPIPAQLIERLHIRRPFTFFIAFFDGRQGRVEVIARDASGQIVATRSAKAPVSMGRKALK